MSASAAVSEKPKAEAKQASATTCRPADGSGTHIVKHRDHKPAAKKARKARRKARRQGGWKATRYLDHDQFKQGYSDAVALCRAGYGFTVFASVMPPDDLPDDAARIRWITRFLGQVGEALKRRGQRDVRIATLEKKLAGKLHGHCLIYVKPENFDVIARMFDVFDKSRVIAFAANDDDAQSVPAHAALIGETQDDLLNAIFYTLKQHRWAGPGQDGSRSARRFWIEAGDPIRGQRLSRSKGAKAILAGIYPVTAKHAPQVAAAAPVAVPVPDPVVTTPTQLAFDFDAPVIDIRSRLEAARIERGMTQGQVAVILGMKQPHYSNAVVRRHDPLGKYARRRALEWLAAA